MEETTISSVDISGIHEYMRMELELLELELTIMLKELKGE